MPVSRTPPGDNTYVYVWVCICLYHTYCIYMPICMYMYMYVYVCVCIPFACYNNTIFDHICMKPWWLSGRYRLIWLWWQVFELQLCQRRFIPALISFCLKNYPPVTSRRTGFLVEPWTASKICMQAHTCKYIHIQSDTYQYMYIYAHICNTSRYRWIHTYTYIYSCVWMPTQIHTSNIGTYKQIWADVYILHIHTHTGNTYTYIHIHADTRYEQHMTFEVNSYMLVFCLYIWAKYMHIWNRDSIWTHMNWQVHWWGIY
jgi:hypothetical protein